MNIKKLLWNIAAGGRKRTGDIDELRKVLILNSLMVPGIFFTGMLGTVAFIEGNTFLGMIDFLLFAIQGVLFVYTRRADDLGKPVRFAVVVLCVFFLLLTAQGGINNTGILWILIFPGVAVFLMGTGKGLMASLLLLAGVMVLFALQGHPLVTGEYPFNFQVRIIAVYLVLTSLSVVIEVLRHTIHKRLQESSSEKDLAIEKLNNSIREIKTLQGILPICLHCKKIRDDEGYWQAVDQYIHNRTDARFSHALCPDCLKEHYPDYPGKEEEQ